MLIIDVSQSKVRQFSGAAYTKTVVLIMGAIGFQDIDIRRC